MFLAEAVKAIAAAPFDGAARRRRDRCRTRDKQNLSIVRWLRRPIIVPAANPSRETESRGAGAFNGLLQRYLPEADVCGMVEGVGRPGARRELT